MRLRLCLIGISLLGGAFYECITEKKQRIFELIEGLSKVIERLPDDKVFDMVENVICVGAGISRPAMVGLSITTSGNMWLAGG